MTDKRGLQPEKNKILYRDSLQPIAKARYVKKMELLEDKDPYELQTGWSSSNDDLADITYPDIVNYLVNGSSAYTMDQMKAYKSLDAYNQFVCGWVSNVRSQYSQDKCLMIAKVRHSQAMSVKPCQPWVVAEKDGKVVTAHCDCVAGLDECCSHVGALLFYVEAAFKIRESKTVTQEKAYWLLPTGIQKVAYSTIDAIDFTSAKTMKRKFDENLINVSECKPKTPRTVKKQPVIPEPSDSEIKDLYRSLQKSGTKPVILSLVPDFANAYIPKSLESKYPKLLSELNDDSFQSVEKDVLFAHCENIHQNLTVSHEEANNVEFATRKQSKSKAWYRFRTGRITASKAKAVCKTDIENPAVSVIKQICNPATANFSNKATDWGCDHEKDAIRKYTDLMMKSHQNFKVNESGLVINPSFPHLGASPDGVATCDCCGEVCVEVKCPFCKRDSKLDDSHGFYLENTPNGLRLKKTHQYFYQIQCQLLVCEKEFCDFVVWTNNDFHVERVEVDTDITDEIVAKSFVFFRKAVLPELIAKFYSKMPLRSVRFDGNVPGQNSDMLICICRTRYDSSQDNVVGCDNENCDYKWLHFKCINIKRAPRKAVWYCPKCRKLECVKKNTAKKM